MKEIEVNSFKRFICKIDLHRLWKYEKCPLSVEFCGKAIKIFQIKFTKFQYFLRQLIFHQQSTVVLDQLEDNRDNRNIKIFTLKTTLLNLVDTHCRRLSVLIFPHPGFTNDEN